MIYLESNGNDNGYIVVSADTSNNLIREFAYEGEPLFVGMEPIATNAIMLASEEEVIDYSSENKTYIDTVRSFDATTLFNTNNKLRYGGITYPYGDVNDTYGSGWVYSSSDGVDGGFTLLDMDNFTGPNHCSLTSTTAIFNYHRSRGYSAIPSDIDTLFNDVKDLATEKGYYTSSGTQPWCIDNLVSDLWSEYGYSGKGNNDFVFWDYASLAKKFKNEVAGNRPGMISFNSGSYPNHTVTFFGYTEYEKEGNTNKLYLRVNDNWSTSNRYVDVTAIANGGASLFEVCRVIP